MMSVSSKTVATIVLSIFGLSAAAVAQPPECGDTEPQTYDPVDLLIENPGLVTGCDALETHCEISTVLETDYVFIKYRPDRAITATFQLDPLAPSHFFVEVWSGASSGVTPAEFIYLRNWQSGFERRVVISSRLLPPTHDGLVLTSAYVTCEDAKDYIDPTGRVEVRVEKNTGTSPQGDSGRWVDEIDIVIPPT